MNDPMKPRPHSQQSESRAETLSTVFRSQETARPAIQDGRLAVQTPRMAGYLPQKTRYLPQMTDQTRRKTSFPPQIPALFGEKRRFQGRLVGFSAKNTGQTAILAGLPAEMELPSLPLPAWIIRLRFQVGLAPLRAG